MPYETELIVLAGLLVLATLFVVLRRGGSPPDRASYDERKERSLSEPLPEGVLDEIARDAYFPVCEQRESTGPVSKFNGCPWLPEGTDWPRCTSCDVPMQLFLQLDFDSLPEGAPRPRGGGLLQVFYCVNSDNECEGDEAWLGDSDAAKLLRTVDHRGPGASPPEDLSFAPQQPQTITGWTCKRDYPDLQDLDESFAHLGAAVRERVGFDDDIVTLMDDKLGGWPSWVQGNDWQDCPECGTRMKLLFQIDSGGHTGHDFGDLGTAHLLWCDRHPARMSFGWACH